MLFDCQYPSKTRSRSRTQKSHQNLRRGRIACWWCCGAGHLRSRCPRVNKEVHNVKCWGCNGTRPARSNCPRANQEYPHRSNVIESMNVSSHTEKDQNMDILTPLREGHVQRAVNTAGDSKRNDR
ncbi:hypothetical protein TNCV_4298741 [Trichonephila clavipes]|nr:hypothetical protein TNCV_4298741 [Trichonephila clavipes]